MAARRLPGGASEVGRDDVGGVPVQGQARGDVYGTPARGGVVQLTGNSTSTVGFWARYRLAAAQARARLVAAADQELPDHEPAVVRRLLG